MILLHSWRSKKQLGGASGFIGGYLAAGPKFTLWTITVWADEPAMRLFRNTHAHLRSMPDLISSCDEAAVVNWITAEAAIPEPEEAAERMKLGRTSKVKYPSAAHREGRCFPDGIVPKKGPRILP